MARQEAKRQDHLPVSRSFKYHQTVMVQPSKQALTCSAVFGVYKLCCLSIALTKRKINWNLESLQNLQSLWKHEE